MFEFFEPARAVGEESYGGEFRWVADEGSHAGEALRRVLGDLASRGCVLKSVDDLAHVVFFDRETPVDERSLGQVASVLVNAPGVIWAEGATMYGEDDDG